MGYLRDNCRYNNRETEFSTEDFLLIHNTSVTEIGFSTDNVPLKKAYELFNEILDVLVYRKHHSRRKVAV